MNEEEKQGLLNLKKARGYMDWVEEDGKARDIPYLNSDEVITYVSQLLQKQREEFIKDRKRISELETLIGIYDLKWEYGKTSKADTITRKKNREELKLLEAKYAK